MAEGGDGSKGRKWSWSKTFKSIGRSGRKPAVTDSFGPSSELDLSWDPRGTYNTPNDFSPSFSPLSPQPSSSHKHSFSFPRSPKSFTPQPESFSSAPFCPPSPTASQYETHLAPRPSTRDPPPRSASLPLGGGRRKKRLGSPRLKSPRTGGPLKPFGRKPDVATLDEVLGIRATLNRSPNPSRSSSTLLTPPLPTSSPSLPSPAPPPPISHLRSPPGRRRLGSPPILQPNRKPKAFGAKVKDSTTRAVHALSRAVSIVSSSASTRSRADSISNSDSGMSSSRRIDSTSSAATSVPTRSHTSRDSSDDLKLVADEEFRKLVAEGKVRSRTTSTASSADGWGGSESSRTTHRSNATFGYSSSFSHHVDLHAPASPPPSSASHSNNHASPLSFALPVYQVPASPRGSGHFASKSTSAAHVPLPVSPSSSTTSLRSLGSLGHGQHSSLRSLGFGDIFGRRPSLPTLLSTIAAGNGQDSDEEQAEFERGQQSPRLDVEVEEMKEVGLLGEDLPSWDERRGSASGSEVDDAEAVLGELMIKLTSPRMSEDGDDDDVDLWTSGAPIGTLSPVDETRSERSRKSTSSDMTSVADLIPLFRSPPTSPPFTPRKSCQFSPRNSFISRMSTTSNTPLPSNTIFPPSPLSFTSQGDSPQAHSLFGDYSINSSFTESSYLPGSSCLDGLHPTPYRSTSPVAPDVRARPTSPESFKPRRPSSSSDRSYNKKKSSKRISRDLPLLPPPTFLPPPTPTSVSSPPSTTKFLPPTPAPSIAPSPTQPIPLANDDDDDNDASRPPSPSVPTSPPPNATSKPEPETGTYDNFEPSEGLGFWERRGSTGGDSLLDLYSSSNCFYFSPTREIEAEDYAFETTLDLPRSPSGSGCGSEGGGVEEGGEGDAWEGGLEEVVEEEVETNSSDSHVIILPPRRRTDIVPPRVVGVGWREEEEIVPPSPAFAFDL